MLEAAVYRANFTTVCLASASHSHAASLTHAHAVVHVLDDLENSVHAGGIGEEFHKPIESSKAMDELEYFTSLNIGVRL